MVPSSSVAVICSGQTGAQWFSGATLPLATGKLETPFYFLHGDYKQNFCILDTDFTVLSLLHTFKCKFPA